MEQHLSFTSHEFAQYLLRALQMFAVRRKAVQEALDREQAYYVRELIQWERLSDFFYRQAMTRHVKAHKMTVWTVEAVSVQTTSPAGPSSRHLRDFRSPGRMVQVEVTLEPTRTSQAELAGKGNDDGRTN